MKIAIGGSAANPPHFGHKRLVEAVVGTGAFDRVFWIISGDRPDKPGLPRAEIRYRMNEMLFADNKKVVMFCERGKAVPTYQVITDWRKRYPRAEIVWYCGADHFVPRERFNGDCDILGFWKKGKELFEKQKFLIVPREGIDMSRLQLPNNYQILEAQIPEISSSEIRRKIQDGETVTETLPEIVKIAKKYTGGRYETV